jgi:hypothetical protein
MQLDRPSPQNNSRTVVRLEMARERGKASRTGSGFIGRSTPRPPAVSALVRPASPCRRAGAKPTDHAGAKSSAPYWPRSGSSFAPRTPSLAAHVECQPDQVRGSRDAQLPFDDSARVGHRLVTNAQ